LEGDQRGEKDQKKTTGKNSGLFLYFPLTEVQMGMRAKGIKGKESGKVRVGRDVVE
jgi:hypothetical protein